MQIVETSVFGVRSVEWRFRQADTNIDILLFPMVHVASPSFYKDISERLSACDVILCEGLESKNVARLARSYTQLTKNRRLGFVSQKEMALDHVKNRLVHADMSGDAFDQEWSGLSIFERWFLPAASAIYGLYLRFFGTKKMLARHLSVNLIGDRERLLIDDFEKFDDLVVNQRNTVLIACIDRTLNNLSGPICIGILYGASHMPAVIQHLVCKHEFEPINGDWITVFEFD